MGTGFARVDFRLDKRNVGQPIPCIDLGRDLRIAFNATQVTVSIGMSRHNRAQNGGGRRRSDVDEPHACIIYPPPRLGNGLHREPAGWQATIGLHHSQSALAVTGGASSAWMNPHLMPPKPVLRCFACGGVVVDAHRRPGQGRRWGATRPSSWLAPDRYRVRCRSRPKHWHVRRVVRARHVPRCRRR